MLLNKSLLLVLSDSTVTNVGSKYLNISQLFFSGGCNPFNFRRTINVMKYGGFAQNNIPFLAMIHQALALSFCSKELWEISEMLSCENSLQVYEILQK